MPGYISPCPAGYHLALDAWVTTAWVAAYALCAETGLLVLSLFRFRLRHTVPAKASISALAVVGCTLIAIVLALWMQQRNAETCFFTSIRYTPEWGARIQRAIAAAMVQANIALVVLAVLFIVASTLTAATLIRGGWGNNRRDGTTRS